jgi:hypothetical protein
MAARRVSESCETRAVQTNTIEMPVVRACRIIAPLHVDPTSPFCDEYNPRHIPVAVRQAFDEVSAQIVERDVSPTILIEETQESTAVRQEADALGAISPEVVL